MKEQLIAILLLYPVFFFYIRSFLSSEILYQLNNSAYKKRKKRTDFYRMVVLQQISTADLEEKYLRYCVCSIILY